MDTKTLDTIKRIDFGKDYWGEVKITVREGKATLVKDEQTYRLDGRPPVPQLSSR